MKKCPNCGNAVEDGWKACINCGVKLEQESVDKGNKNIMFGEKKEFNTQKHSEKYAGIIVLALLIISLAVMCLVKAVPGFLIYLVGVVYAITKLKGDTKFDENKIGEYLKENLKKENFTKETFMQKGIFLLAIVMFPIMIAIGVYNWIYTDTARQMEEIEQEYLEEMDNINQEFQDSMDEIGNW